MLAVWPDGAKAQWARLHRLERRSATSPPSAAAEPLTEREVTVLRMLRSTLSLREIGQQLYVSPNTVKTHAKAIYRKLDVSTRHDAIARGHEIGIL
jgi:LuxR family maltose regulon positive regulatory protein